MWKVLADLHSFMPLLSNLGHFAYQQVYKFVINQHKDCILHELPVFWARMREK